MAAVPSGNFQSILDTTDLNRPVIVIDDFFTNPDQVREFALRQEYQPDKVYPGKRSPKQSIEGRLVSSFERFVGKPILKMDSAFQYQPEDFDKQSFVHGDLCDWAAVLYLNNDCDGRPGTSFFRHKSTGFEKLPFGADLMFKAIEKGVQPADILREPTDDRFDIDKWDITLTVPMRFNRLVLYNAKLYHRNASAWGNDVTDSRLVQGFFIFTEPFDPSKAAGVEMLERADAARSA